MDCEPYKLATIVLTVLAIVLVISVIGLAIGFVAVSTREQPLHSDSSRHRDPVCPYGWFGYKEKCYYISEKEMNWTASEGFCQSYNASLINTESVDEKEFLMHFKHTDSLWSNLRKEAQLWKYPSGANATLPVLGDGGKCAYITVGKEVKVAPTVEMISSRCSTEHRWICSKPDAFQNPQGA